MSDADWIEIDRAVASAVGNFQRGVEFSRHPDFRTDSVIGSALRMGFMHAIQAGHTSLESALLRILDLIDETRPRGDAWHADLIGRAGQELARRPAILPPGLAASADETRRFRNRDPRLRQFRPEPDRANGACGGPGRRRSPRSARSSTPDHAAFASIRCAISVSAICTAFSAAPLRRLSETHQNDSPCSTVGSLRMRLTNTASSPALSAGVT